MKDTDKTKGQPIVKEFGVKPKLLTIDQAKRDYGNSPLKAYPARSSAATAGRSLPSIRSRKAPPPVEI